MKRALINLALIIATFTIQSSIFPLLPFLSAIPDLLLILTFSFDFMKGKRAEVVYDMVAGLLLGLFHSGPFGFYTLFYVYMGYINDICTRCYYKDYTTLPLILYFFNELTCNLYVYILHFLIRGRLDFLYYFRGLMVPEVIFTVVTTLFVYCLLLHINRWLHEMEKRRDANIV